MKQIVIFVFILSVLFGGCTTRSNEEYIREIVGSKLVINLDSMSIGDGSSSFFNEMNKQHIIVVYSDSSNCNACNIQFPAWRIRFNELRLENNNVGLIFIINTGNISDLEMNAKVFNAPGLRLYDTQGVFKKDNKNSDNIDLHTFLLDKDNNVILVGNPITNHQILALYKKAIGMYVEH